MSDENDLVLGVLLEVRKEVAPELDENLLRQSYEIQRRHQFSQKRDQSFTAMERLIDEAVDAMIARQEN